MIRTVDGVEYLVTSQGASAEPVGLAARDDLVAVRWLGIRHGDDHMHLVASLVRQDGRTVWARNDYRSSHAAAPKLEVRYGLYRVARRSPPPGR